MQLGLFDTKRAVPALGPLDAGRERVLEEGAWIFHRPGWVSQHAALFDTLAREIPFKRVRRAMYERVVDVPRGTYFGPIDHPLVDEMERTLTARFGPAPHRSAAIYEHQQDSVAWHGDKTYGDEHTLVATVSLGAPRRFLLRPTKNRERRPTLAFSLGWGDLLVMGGTAQHTYEHAVPKSSTTTGPRLVVMFRSCFDPG